MSVAQPGPATTPAVTLPRFPITLWGYERRYVDNFVSGLVEQLERERHRSDQAERARQQLDDAGRAAAKLLAEAGRRIQAATDAAEQQAAERLREAEEQVRKLGETARGALADAQAERARIEAATAKAAEEQLARVERDATTVLARAHEEARRAQEHADRERQQLEAERQSMVEQLVQVYAPLGLTLVDVRGQLEASAQEVHPTKPQEPNPDAAATEGRHARQPDVWTKFDGEAP